MSLSSPLHRTLCASASLILLSTSAAFAQPMDHGNGGDHPHSAPQANAPQPQAAPQHTPHRDAPRAAAPAAHQEAPHPEAAHEDYSHQGRDHNDHHHAPDVIVDAHGPGYARSPRYIPEPRVAPIVYHERGPRYYSSYYYSRRYIPIETASPYVEVRCGSQPIIGTVVGGATGALIGNQFGHRGGRTMATLGGALLGGIIGHSIDTESESCAYQALEYAQPNTQVAWADPETNYSYSVIPGPITQAGDGRYCREYQAKILVGNRMEDGYGTACRQPDGSWQVVN